MRKWYPHLVQNEDETKRNVLLVSERFVIGNIIIARDLGHRTYARFNSFIEFVRHSHLEVADTHRCFYEIVPFHLPNKPYFDLDIKLDDTSEHRYTREEGLECITLLLAAIHQLLPMVSPNDVMVFSSHGSTKMSYHVIIDRWCFSDGENAKGFCQEVVELLPERLREMVDRRMYKKHQNFRTYLSHKYDSDRIKRIDILSTWTPSEPPETEIEKIFQISLASIISNVSYCRFLPRFAKEKSVYSGESVQISPTQLDRSLQLMASYVDESSLAFREIKSGMIMLKRLRPSFCRLCCRQHEHENPFLTIDRRGGVWYHCRREETNQRVFIGEIPPPTVTLTDAGPQEIPPSPVHAPSLPPLVVSEALPSQLVGMKLLESLKPPVSSIKPIQFSFYFN